jgi:hypothetical protein
MGACIFCSSSKSLDGLAGKCIDLLFPMFACAFYFAFMAAFAFLIVHAGLGPWAFFGAYKKVLF